MEFCIKISYCSRWRSGFCSSTSMQWTLVPIRSVPATWKSVWWLLWLSGWSWWESSLLQSMPTK